MSNIIQTRRDTAANWTSVNPILASGEQGIETDTKKVKYGDGTTVWTSLSYQSGNDGDAIHDNVAAEISAITEKVTPVGADVLIIEDSAAANVKKRIQITNLPGGADADAIHDNVASEISAITVKGTPVAGDFLLIEDSAAANVKKHILVSSLPAGTPAADSITNVELANMVQATVKGRASGSGTGDPVDLTAAQLRTIANVEAGATADQTNAEIKTAYEANADTNAFDDTEQSKLAAIESSATADQTGAEIKTAYDGENFAANSMLGNNTGAPAGPIELTKTQVLALLNVEDGATANQTNAEIKTAYEANADTNEFDDTEQSKLAAIEALADVTDAANVDSAGAVMDSDISPGEGFLRKTGAGAYTAHKSNLAAVTNPGTTDDSAAGYSVGSVWINVTLDLAYVCLDSTNSSAVWLETTVDDQTAAEIEAIVSHDNLQGVTAAEHVDWAASAGTIHTDNYIEGGDGTDGTAIHDNVTGEIVAITEKVSPVGADVLLIEDSAAGNAKKRVQITNLPGGADADAIHDNVASEISAITVKGTPVGGDFLLIEDSAAANVKKHVLISSLPAGSEVNDLTAAVVWANVPVANTPTAIHDDVSSEISTLTSKTSPVGADNLLIEDSATGNSKKRVLLSNLPAVTPPANSVTNVELANMVQDTIKGRATLSGTGDPVDLTAAQVRAIIVVEANASADQTGAEIKTAYDGENFAANSLLGNNTGSPAGPIELTVAQALTLLGVEAGSTADQTGAEIKSAYDGENFAANSMLGNNTGSPAGPIELTATEVRALLNVENAATADQTGAEIKSAYDGENFAANTFLGNNTGSPAGPIEMTKAQALTALNAEDGATADQTAGEIEAIVSHDNLQSIQADEHVPSGDAETLANKDLTATTNTARHTKNLTVEEPSSSEDITFFFIDRAVTVTQVRAVLSNGSSTPTVTYQMKHHTDRANAGNALTTSAAVTSVTTGTDATLSDATIPADSWVWFETTVQGGTVPEISIFMEYTDD